jgi:phosphatidylglycerol lysyltransferase
MNRSEAWSLDSPGASAWQRELAPGVSKRRRLSQTFWAFEQMHAEGREAIPRPARLALVRRHGDFTLAYSTAVQPRLQFFGDQDGYIAFGRRWGFVFALGDPVCHPHRAPSLLSEFLHAHPRAAFCQINSHTAQQLTDAGYFINPMGVDTTLDLTDYSFAGKEKEWLRYAANWCQRRQFKIRESSIDDIGVEQIDEISEAWRSTRTIRRKEVRFLNRPIGLTHEEGVRRFFFCEPGGRPRAFIFFDPLYRDEQRIGYVTCIKRRHPDAPPYCEHALMKHAIETFQAERYTTLKLGLSPLAWIGDHPHHNRWLDKLFRWSFRSRLFNRWCYNLQGHAEYKRRFRGVEETFYFATPARFNHLRLAALLVLMGAA